MKKNNKETNTKYEVIIIIALSFTIILLWDTFIIFPIKLFVVLLHEISHVFSTIISGGSVNEIQFGFNLSGKTVTKGGNLLLIASSGYLGSLIVGILLFLTSNNTRSAKWLTTFLSFVILIVAVNLLKGGIEIFVSLVIAIVLFSITRFINQKYSNIFLKFLGLTSCLYIITDIKDDLFTKTIRETDAQIIELLTGIPSIIIATLWLVISLFAIIWIFRKSFSIKYK